jgi:outer membrane protein OmpA-like peptidoglycan-associated protein
VKRLLLVSGVLVLVAAIAGFLIYKANQRLDQMDGRIAEMQRQVMENTQLTKEQAVAVSAAGQRANEAANRAEIAAGAKALAEQQRQQALSGKEQAESAAFAAAHQATEVRAQLEALRKQREQELDQMQQALNRVVETRRTANGMVLVLPDSKFKFDFDSAELKARNREVLSRVAGILLVSKGYGLSVYGYTDDVGSADYNQKLSERRADSVRAYLVQSGLDSALINTKGFGKANPLVAGNTDAARARNRRVEIALTDSEIKYGTEVNNVR